MSQYQEMMAHFKAMETEEKEKNRALIDEFIQYSKQCGVDLDLDDVKFFYTIGLYVEGWSRLPILA